MLLLLLRQLRSHLEAAPSETALLRLQLVAAAEPTKAGAGLALCNLKQQRGEQQQQPHGLQALQKQVRKLPVR